MKCPVLWFVEHHTM